MDEWSNTGHSPRRPGLVSSVKLNYIYYSLLFSFFRMYKLLNTHKRQQNGRIGPFMKRHISALQGRTSGWWSGDVLAGGQVMSWMLTFLLEFFLNHDHRIQFHSHVGVLQTFTCSQLLTSNLTLAVILCENLWSPTHIWQTDLCHFPPCSFHAWPCVSP